MSEINYDPDAVPTWCPSRARVSGVVPHPAHFDATIEDCDCPGYELPPTLCADAHRILDEIDAMLFTALLVSTPEHLRMSLVRDASALAAARSSSPETTTQRIDPRVEYGIECNRTSRKPSLHPNPERMASGGSINQTNATHYRTRTVGPWRPVPDESQVSTTS